MIALKCLRCGRYLGGCIEAIGAVILVCARCGQRTRFGFTDGKMHREKVRDAPQVRVREPCDRVI